MEGDRPENPWGEVQRKKRSELQQTRRVLYGQGNVAEEETTSTPEWLLRLMKMEEYDGYDANQIMELKELKPTDIDTKQGRLLLPKHVDRSFLKDDELKTLAAIPKKGVSSLFIRTKGAEYDLELRDWQDKLVLSKGWGKVIREEKFETGEKYPLWCFRSIKKNDKLCFAFVDTNQVLLNKDDKLSVSPNDTEEEVANKNESSSFSYLDNDELALPTLADQLKGFDDDGGLASLPTLTDQVKPGFYGHDDLAVPTSFDYDLDLDDFFREDESA